MHPVRSAILKQPTAQVVAKWVTFSECWVMFVLRFEVAWLFFILAPNSTTGLGTPHAASESGHEGLGFNANVLRS